MASPKRKNIVEIIIIAEWGGDRVLVVDLYRIPPNEQRRLHQKLLQKP